MPDFKTLDDLNPSGKTCLVRVDLNVPMADGKVTDTTRIQRILPTIRELSDNGGRVVLLAHFGRPNGQVVPEMSLRQVVPALTEALGKPVAFAEECAGDIASAAIGNILPGDVIVLENTRFQKAEEANDPDLAKAMAALGDVYVNDAFSAAHRAHVSTEGLAHLLPAYAGRTMEAELSALSAGLDQPVTPVMAIVGGAKVSSKLDLLQNLMTKVDMLVIGGGMANTFLAAQGKNVGKSLCEHDLTKTAKHIMDTAAENECEIVLPVDAMVSREFRANAPHEIVSVDAVPADAMMLDVGPQSIALIKNKLDQTKTLVWNGPLGAFEMTPFDTATVAAARHAGKLTQEGKLVSVAGGGDTVAAMNHASVGDQLSYISTAGGAFLEWMEGKPLPGVDALKSS